MKKGSRKQPALYHLISGPLPIPSPHPPTHTHPHPQGSGYTERAMLIYDGLHYDALALSASNGAPEHLDTTLLKTGSPQEATASAGAAQLVAACHAARQFTDIANFALRCGVCEVGLKGEREAAEHAKETGHTRFSEY